MPTTTGFYQTENGSKYLQQLCKHFGHKIETSYDSEKGYAAFEMGTAYMTADSKGLTAALRQGRERCRPSRSRPAWAWREAGPRGQGV